MKKFTLGLVLGLGIAISGSAYGALVFPVGVKQSTPLVPQISQTSAYIAPIKMSVGDQIAKGYTFDVYTGERLVSGSIEIRIKALEDRVAKLEAKK